MNNKVVYGWFADGLPFYIGIGTVKRSQSEKNRNKYCSRKRAKAEKDNNFEVRILHENLSWKDACEIEISLISLYGRIDNKTGILTNMTDGGEGACNPSKETRDRMSRARKGEGHPFFGKRHSKETKDRIGKANFKPVQTPDGRFGSSTEAYSFYGVSKNTFGRWLKDPRKPEYYRL